LDEVYRSLSSSLCNFLHSPLTSSLLGPNIFLNTLFSNTLSLCSSLNVSDQVSHPYKTMGKIIVLYILMMMMMIIIIIYRTKRGASKNMAAERGPYRTIRIAHNGHFPRQNYMTV
jgi:phosphate starvation-inducible membrane PsiE